MNRSRSTNRWVQVLFCSLCLAFAGAGCGDDEDGGKPPPKRRGGGKKKAAKKSKRGPKLSAYEKVTDRKELSESDFMPDPTGSVNRDPFRSYVVQQATTSDDESETSSKLRVCKDKQTVATNFALRDLKLAAIVTPETSRSRRRGTYALFRDPAQFGHIVRRGYCIGKERAVVGDIVPGVVRLEVRPEAQAGTTGAVQTRQIPIFPDEMVIDPETGQLIRASNDGRK